MDQKEYQSLILGALLHDIGKFMQRAEVPCRYENDDYEMQRVCKYHKEGNYFSHKHTLWAVEFFEKYQTFFPSLPTTFQNPDDNLANFASKHHNPDTPLQWIIAEADRLSSGMDRLEKDEEDEVSGRDAYKRIRLYPILEEVDLEGKKKEKIFQRTELNSLTLQKESIFPCNSNDLMPKEGELLVGNYDKLWKGFIKEFICLPSGDIQSFLESLLFLLEKYTWCIPSSTIDLPDISLFDHSKTTAAIAACLFNYHQSSNTLIEQKIRNQKLEKYTLICGDISGIQKFIYNITSKGAAKSLKGRSFYLQLLAEGTAKFILRKLSYPITNLLYASGGKFYLLLANQYDHKLEEIKKEVNRGLLEKYNGEIYLSIGWRTLKGIDFFGKNFPLKWGDASMNANEEKRKKFSYLAYYELFEPKGYGGDRELCDICKKEAELVPREDDPDVMLCRDCSNAERLGKSLFSANYLIEVYAEKEGLNNLGFGEIPFISTKYYLLSNLHMISKISAERLTIYTLNSTEFISHEFQDKNYSLGFKFVGGTIIPHEKGQPITFDDFAEKSDGIKRLGILRMDVDNLGRIFMKGFGNRASISRVSTLSRSLSLFFDGYLNTICQTEKFKDRVYIIYSGGDDLFIVGSWHRIADLAEEIYREFKNFTANNPSFTLSGGITLTGGKYPIYRGASHAGDAEELAKEYKRRVKIDGKEEEIEKDALTFLNKPLSWNDLEISKGIKGLLYDCIVEGKSTENGNNKKLSKGILERLRQIYLLYENNKRYWQWKDLDIKVIEENIKYNKWLWRMVYYLDRIGRENSIFYEEIRKIQDAILHDSFNGKGSQREIIEFIDIPTRWVEFLIREEE